MTDRPTRPGSATILDVAHRAGVSRTTVSRVLNSPEAVSASARQRVMRAVDELGFSPSLAARSLRNGRTGTIALLVGDISQPFHARLAKAVAHAAEEHGLAVLLLDLDHSETRLVAMLQRLSERGIDGAIISTADDVGSDSIRYAVQQLEDRGAPVLFGSTFGPPTAALPYALHVEVGRRATELVLRGGPNVLLLVGRSGAPLSDRLVEGAREALAGTPPITYDGGFSFEGGRDVVAAHLAAGRPLSGVVAINSPMALGAIQAIEDAGLNVPADVGVVAAENLPANAQTRPPLTSVGVDPWESGAASVQTLLRLLDGQVAREPELLTRVVERATTLRG